MNSFSGNLNKFLNRRSVKYGLPFFLIIVGGSFGLKEFTQLRYQFSRVSSVADRDMLTKAGIDMKKPGEVTVDGEFEKLQKLDIDNWEQVRGPRPWEENAN